MLAAKVCPSIFAAWHRTGVLVTLYEMCGARRYLHVEQCRRLPALCFYYGRAEHLSTSTVAAV